MEVTVKFVLRRDLEDKKGQHPLMLVLHLGGKRKLISTGIKLIPDLWSPEKQEIVDMTAKQKAALEKKFRSAVPPKGQLIQYQDDLLGLRNKVRLKFEVIQKLFFGNPLFSFCSQTSSMQPECPEKTGGAKGPSKKL